MQISRKVGSTRTAFTLSHADVATRINTAMQWLRRFPNDSFYVLLVLKPSGLEIMNELQSKIEDLGFEQGLDLLPGDWNALPYSESVGAAP